MKDNSTKTKIGQILTLSEMSSRKIITIFALLMIISLGIRLSYFPYNVPITLDGVDYFTYAMEIAKTGKFPAYTNFANNGWPSFLSIFFSLMKSDNFLDYMMLQRYLAVGISIVTAIPIYLLCMRFFSKVYSLIGVVLFLFDPRIIINSLNGLTEPLFLFLGVITFYLFLDRSTKYVWASFGTAAIASLIRYEFLLVLIPISMMYFIRFRRNNSFILKYIIAIAIFILLIVPMAYIRIQTTGQDGLLSSLMGHQSYLEQHIIHGIPDSDDPIPGHDNQNKILYFLSSGIFGILKYSIWSWIPILIFFIPVGCTLIVKNIRKLIDCKVITIFLLSGTMLIPTVFAYGRGIQETRYLFIIFPLFYLISLYTVKRINLKLEKRFFSLILIICIIIGCMAFLEYKKVDYEYERDAFIVAKEIVKDAHAINNYSENKYIKEAEIARNWPNLPKANTSGHVSLETTKISTESYKTVEDFISKSREYGLTHIVADKVDKSFLKDVFVDDKNFPYLLKTFDSTEHGFKYQVKIYKIDYNIFEKMFRKNK